MCIRDRLNSLLNITDVPAEVFFSEGEQHWACLLYTSRHSHFSPHFILLFCLLYSLILPGLLMGLPPLHQRAQPSDGPGGADGLSLIHI